MMSIMMITVAKAEKHLCKSFLSFSGGVKKNQCSTVFTVESGLCALGLFMHGYE